MPVVSFYHQPGVKNADGTFYGGHRIAAPPRFAFGTVIEFRYKGRTLRGVVADRGGAIRGNRYDLPLRAFASLVGPGWRKQGVAHVGCRVLSRPRFTRPKFSKPKKARRR